MRKKKHPKTIFEGGDVTSKIGIRILETFICDHHFMLLFFQTKNMASLEYLFSLVG